MRRLEEAWTTRKAPQFPSKKASHAIFGLVENKQEQKIPKFQAFGRKRKYNTNLNSNLKKQ